MTWLVYSSEPAAQAREEQISAALGYPVGGTLRYAVPEPHPTSTDYALTIGRAMDCSGDPHYMREVSEILTGEEQGSLQSEAQMKAAGWFPEPPDPPGGDG